MASDGLYDAYFGWSLSISGTTAAVGAMDGYVDGSQEGTAYVFNLGGGAWSQTAELTASDGALDDEFGFSVAVSGSVVIVGAPNTKWMETPIRDQLTCSARPPTWFPRQLQRRPPMTRC